MAKATIVYFEEIAHYDNTTRIFRTPSRESLWVKSFENGIAVADPMCGCTITSFAEMIAGCFDKDSNFASELLIAFNCNEDTAFTGIQFEFNGVTLLVTKENADKDKIYAEWDAGRKANAEKYRLEREAYMKTPAYRAERAKQLKIQTRREQVETEVLIIDEQTRIEFKDDEAKANWEKWVELYSKYYYSYGVVKYACRWAKYMQHLMKKHNKSIFQIADKASCLSDTEGITGFMHVCAVSMLSECWKYGDDLRKWHNKECGDEDAKGVINPAVLTINVG
ncbi:MAG: hypothetical protein PHP54_05725 [Clostridia bacterium]|nr:hypothetical protein [Clostridia bacterium]